MYDLRFEIGRCRQFSGGPPRFFYRRQGRCAVATDQPIGRGMGRQNGVDMALDAMAPIHRAEQFAGIAAQIGDVVFRGCGSQDEILPGHELAGGIEARACIGADDLVEVGLGP